MTSPTWRDREGSFCLLPEAHDTQISHRFAPEISLSRFQERNGQGYIDLLKSLLPDQHAPNQYVRIGHPAVDAYFGIQTPFDTAEVMPMDARRVLQQM